MRYQWMFAVLFLFLASCSNLDVSKVSDQDMQRISENLIVCKSPYMRYGSDCCMDQNNDSVCDKDELSNKESNENKIIPDNNFDATTDSAPLEKAEFDMAFDSMKEQYKHVDFPATFKVDVKSKDSERLSCDFEERWAGNLADSFEFNLESKEAKSFDRTVQPFKVESKFPVQYLVTCSSIKKSPTVKSLEGSVYYTKGEFTSPGEINPDGDNNPST